MTSLHFLYRVHVNGDGNRFVIVAFFERFDFFFYHLFDSHRIIISIELDENLFDILILDAGDDWIFRAKDVMFEHWSETLGKILCRKVEFFMVNMT